MSDTLPVGSSYMKGPRAHYRMRGGKLLAFILLLLLIGLVLLVLKANSTYFGDTSPQRTVTLVLIDLSLMLIIMAYVVQHRARLLWTRAHDGVLGTRLQSRIILMFSGIAIVPTLIVATFSILFFNVGIKSWFDNQVSNTLEDSVVVATAYITEHKDAIRNDAVGLSDVLQAQGPAPLSSPAAFSAFLSAQSAQRSLSEAVVFDRQQRVLARTEFSFSLTFERFPEQVLSRADSGQAAVFGDDQNKIQAVVKISNSPALYLMVARVVDPKVLQQMQAARETVNEYQQLKQDLQQLQKQFFLVFILIAMLILLASLWAGILLAVRLIEPLRALMAATEHVRGGDYAIRVPEGRTDDEIANLGRTFNRMIGQLDSQRRDLIEANRMVDERRRFTEAVLLGVSAGIIALDGEQHITLHNRTALELLGREALTGESIDTILPGVRDLVKQVIAKPERIASGEIIVQHGERRVILHVQVTAERLGTAIEGYIVTFDDITELVSAQRSAAWADVARRIAHEIKNPLTPITLSTERIRKKFSPTEGSEERESFDKYIETITRHVRDIGRMVEEFVAYARMPSSVFRNENLVSIVKKSVFSAQTATPDIKFTQKLPDHAVEMLCDESQLGQMLLNLLKNAGEALEASAKKQVDVTLTTSDTQAILTIDDSGPGFPADKIATLTEPYVTTRAKGTGLGLAIVKRSVEEHKGTLTLSNNEQGGARVTIIFPLGQ